MTAKKRVFEQIPSPGFADPAQADEAYRQLTTRVGISMVASAGPVAPWAGPIAFEGVATGDGRMMAPGAFTWDELPIPFRQVVEDQGEHKGAVAVGRIDRIERRADGVIWGEGVFDLGSDRGREAARLVGEKITTGVSVDPDEWAYQIRVKKELLEQGVEEDPDGVGLALEDSEGRVTVAEVTYDDEMVVFTRVRIRAATLVDIPAYSRARIGLAGEAVPDQLAASAGMDLPPIEWFANPKLDKPTRLTVTDDGRVFGHVAAWETCHIGYPGQCVPPPHSPTNYAEFHNAKSFRVRSGNAVERIAVGKLTALPSGAVHEGALPGHAPPEATPAQTMAHYYDDPDAVVAFVRCGEDQHGIWAAGMVRPGASEGQILTLETSPPSGDWRNLGKGLDLLAVLCVNTPGFPVPLVASANREGQMSLVAAGRVFTEQAVPEIEYVRKLMRADEAAELAQRVNRARVAGRVMAMATRRRRERSRGALSLQER